MTREIKFRGKRVDNGEWCYGYLVCNNIINVFQEVKYVDYSTEGVKEIRCIQTATKRKVDEKTVGQYTGLNDKNGKEIFEGDIIEHENKRWKTSIYYRDGGFRSKPNDHEIDYEMIGKRSRVVEVIGNIFENI